MRRDHARSLLEQGLAELTNARRHLDYSFQQVAGLPDTLAGATEQQLESTEAFTGRLAACTLGFRVHLEDRTMRSGSRRTDLHLRDDVEKRQKTYGLAQVSGFRF
jgi:hypothetical protein